MRPQFFQPHICGEVSHAPIRRLTLATLPADRKTSLEQAAKRIGSMLLCKGSSESEIPSSTLKNHTILSIFDTELLLNRDSETLGVSTDTF